MNQTSLYFATPIFKGMIKSDLEEYRGMIGKYTEYNTLVTEELIKRTEDRILELEAKEKKWNDTIRGLLIQD